MKRKPSEITIGSGNVFLDLDLPNPEELDSKARLGELLVAAIKQRKLTQNEIADRLEIPQPTVSAIVNHRFEGFSIERLMNLLVRLDRTITIVVTEGVRSSEHGISIESSASDAEFCRPSLLLKNRMTRSSNSAVRFAPEVYASALRLTAFEQHALPRLC